MLPEGLASLNIERKLSNLVEIIYLLSGKVASALEMEITAWLTPIVFLLVTIISNYIVITILVKVFYEPTLGSLFGKKLTWHNSEQKDRFTFNDTSNAPQNASGNNQQVNESMNSLLRIK